MASTDNLFFAEWKIIYENTSHADYKSIRIMWNSFLRMMAFLMSTRVKLNNCSIVPIPVYVKPTSHFALGATNYATQFISDGCISNNSAYDGDSIRRLSSHLYTNGELMITYPITTPCYFTTTQIYYVWPDWILTLP